MYYETQTGRPFEPEKPVIYALHFQAESKRGNSRDNIIKFYVTFGARAHVYISEYMDEPQLWDFVECAKSINEHAKCSISEYDIMRLFYGSDSIRVIDNVVFHIFREMRPK